MRLFTIMSCGGVYQLLLQTCSLKLLITFRVGETYFSRTYQDVFLEYLYGSLRRKRSCTSEERRVFSPTGRAKIGAIAKNRPKNALSFVQ